MEKAQRDATNQARLKLCYPPFAKKVAAILSDMEGHGWQPLIDSGVFRTHAEQMEKVRQGVSKVSWGFHNARNLGGTPGSLAADITDARTPFEEPDLFKLHLARIAIRHALHTGIIFGLRGTQHDIMIDYLYAEPVKRLPHDLGWDPWHVEPLRISLQQAKSGLRPIWDEFAGRQLESFAHVGYNDA